jgi:hypothetical protein
MSAPSTLVVEARLARDRLMALWGHGGVEVVGEATNGVRRSSES